MAAISWNPSSFCFAILPFHFPLEFLGLAVGVSYVVTKFATVLLESLWVYYTITNKSTSAQIPL
jgi:hypothetical protein